MTRFDYLLGCISHQEAQTVIDELLNVGLVSEAEVIEPTHVSSPVDRVRLILTSLSDNFKEIEHSLNRLLSRQFELVKLPSTHTTNDQPVKI
jgi:hypothetical protein